MKTHWTLGKRIAVSFAALLAITVGLGGFAALGVWKVERQAGIIVKDCLPGIYVVGKIDSAVAEAERNIREHLLATDAAELREIEGRMDAQRAAVTQLYRDYEATITTAEDRALFTQLSAAREPYLTARTGVIELSRSGRKQEAIEVVRTRLDPAYRAYAARMDALVEFNKRNSDAQSSLIVETVRDAFIGAAAGTLIALIIGVGAAFFVIRGLNATLRRIIGSVSDSASQVGSAAGQVSSASQSLAEGASEQAASVEETSASLEEMSSMTKNNTDHAERANDLARRTRQSADAGAVQMEEMRRAMDAIKGSSDAIAKIVSTIEEIAFQTNILALNAAVEAARAGEAGMGFAVVADEVRSLAQRAAQAAQETSSKIEDAIHKSEHGVNISTSVAKALSEIVENVRQMDSIVAEIATASREQTQGIGQVNTALSQMDKVTQSNAGNAEENAAAAEELNAQAAAMQDAIAELKELVGGAGRSSTLRDETVAASPVLTTPAHNRLKPMSRSMPAHRHSADSDFENFSTMTLSGGTSRGGTNGSNGHGGSNGSNGHHTNGYTSKGSNGHHGPNGQNGSNGNHSSNRRNGAAADADFFSDTDDSGNGRH